MTNLLLDAELRHVPITVPLGTYMPKMFCMDPLDMLCTICGEKVRNHMVGGPGPSCPLARTPLWMWD
jgi:hypothetical protein